MKSLTSLMTFSALLFVSLLCVGCGEPAAPAGAKQQTQESMKTDMEDMTKMMPRDPSSVEKK